VVPVATKTWNIDKTRGEKKVSKRNKSPDALTVEHSLQSTQVISCNAALSACEKCGEWQHALDLLKLGAFHWHHVVICQILEQKQWQRTCHSDVVASM
jgi:hypothetical protein